MNKFVFLKDCSGSIVDWRKIRLDVGRLHWSLVIIIQVRSRWVEVERNRTFKKC